MTAPATKLRRMGAGLCYGCGDSPPAEGKLQCEACLARQRGMWAAWREKVRLIENEEAALRAEALEEGVAAAREIIPGPDPGDGPEGEPPAGFSLIATHKNVIRVSDTRGRPVLAVLPWDAYRDLLRLATGEKKRRGRKPRADREAPPAGSGPPAGPPGRPPVADLHILNQLIREHPDCSGAEIERIFRDRTGVRLHRNTVNRYQRKARERQAAGGPAPEAKGPGLVVNGVDLGEYDAVIAEAVVRAGVRPDSVRESEEYADGLVALYEAAEDFGPDAGMRFVSYAAERIRRAIYRGREDRKVKIAGKSGRVINFSEIGDESFDISEMIDDSRRLR